MLQFNGGGRCPLYTALQKVSGISYQLFQGLNLSFIQYRVSPSEDYFNRVALGVTKNYEGDQYTWKVKSLGVLIRNK